MNHPVGANALVIWMALPLVGPALAQTVPAAITNLVQNSSFEQPLPTGWAQDPSSNGMGLIYRSERIDHSGKSSLRLLPNRFNTNDYPGGTVLNVAQILPVKPFIGKSVFFSGWMQAKANVTAELRLVALSSGGTVYWRQLTQGPTADGQMHYRQDILDLPDDPNLILLFVSCAAEGTFGLATFDDITVSGDKSVTSGALGRFDPGPPLTASIYIGANQSVRRIPSTLYGMNIEFVGGGQGLWDQQGNQLEPHLLSLVQDLGATVLRFPGGLFADYYHWKNGVGEQSSRPVLRPGPVNFTTTNSFGTDEALALAKATGGELQITVNALTGTSQEAADWVRYTNNGTRRVEYWDVGNEMYLAYPIDPSKPISAGEPTFLITPDEYATRLNSFATAMKAVDPTIKIGADVEFNYAVTAFRYFPDWADVVLKNSASQIDFLSVHNGLGPGIGVDGGWDVRTVYAAMLSAPILLKNALADLSAKIDALAGDNAPRIRIGVTELGPLFDTSQTSRFVDHVKTLGAAMYAADILKVLVENPRTELGDAFKLVDGATQGWIGPRDGALIPKAPYYALQMFRQHFGPVLVNTTVQSPSYSTRSIGWAEAVQGVPYLDVVSSVNDNLNTVYIIAINKHFDRAIRADIVLTGFTGNGTGTAWTLNGKALDANTGTQLTGDYAPQAVAQPDGRFNLGGPGEIWVTSADVSVTGTNFQYEFPAHSVTAIELRGAPPAAIFKP